MHTYFNNVNKNFGFGCMRLPMVDGKVNYEETKKMVDTFLANGFNYFDTAHGYLDGKSEIALRECLTSRYPREDYILTNKLSTHHFTKNEEIRPLFASQLEICGVDYFDFYLMHALVRIVERIDFDKINKLIDSVENISEKRKEFYKTILEQRYEKILLNSYKELMWK